MSLCVKVNVSKMNGALDISYLFDEALLYSLYQVYSKCLTRFINCFIRSSKKPRLKVAKLQTR